MLIFWFFVDALTRHMYSEPSCDVESVRAFPCAADGAGAVALGCCFLPDLDEGDVSRGAGFVRPSSETASVIERYAS